MNRNFSRSIAGAMLIFAVLCVVLALCVEWNAADFFTIVNTPLASVGAWIRGAILDGNYGGGWAVYLLLGLLPLVFPAVKTAQRKRFYLFRLVWVALSAFAFVMLYFFINPHLLDSSVFVEMPEESAVAMRQGTMVGMQATFCLLLTVCVLCELGAYLKRSGNAYFLAKVILYAYAFGVIFSACFLGVAAAKINWNALDLSPELSDYVRLNVGLNRFAISFSLVAEWATAAVTVTLLAKCGKLLDRFQADAFHPANIRPLEGVIRLCCLSVFVTLGAMILNNLLQLCLSKWLLNASYSLQIPLGSLLAVCLVMIFAKIMKRAILVNEENKLTI